MLLDEETRARLPPLYANEEAGLSAQAVVKFFTPDAGWTWYASEFDSRRLPSHRKWISPTGWGEGGSEPYVPGCAGAPQASVLAQKEPGLELQ